MKARFVGPITLVLSLSLGAAALGDPTPAPHATPSPGVAVPDIPGVPPTVMNSPVVQSILNAAGGLLQTTNGPTAYGKITYFKRFDLQLQTAPTVYRQVHLHRGTVINPRGTTLQPGMTVNVSGVPQSDGSLDANTITVQ
jgi:hypothetical protein